MQPRAGLVESAEGGGHHIMLASGAQSFRDTWNESKKRKEREGVGSMHKHVLLLVGFQFRLCSF